MMFDNVGGAARNYHFTAELRTPDNMSISGTRLCCEGYHPGVIDGNTYQRLRVRYMECLEEGGVEREERVRDWLAMEAVAVILSIDFY